MSQILWLKLDGIRSYCYIPSNVTLETTAQVRKKAEQEQTIRFKLPLTLIWGHNGSGKTTIIEALRAVTTGTQPPNSDKGKNFLTDSQLLRQTQTQAVIELGFKSLNQKELIVRRHFTVTNTSGQQKFSTGRSTIQVKEKQTGSLETLNHTCADVDRQIPFFLGVSVPVLTNVLFCHQEEQLWMFSDNSNLKKIFDELFDTTQYSRLQEQLKEQIKKNNAELKMLNEKVTYSKRDMQDASRIKGQLCKEMQEIQHEGCDLEQIQQQLALIRQKVDKQNYQQQILEIQNQLSIAQYKKEQINHQIIDLEKQQKFQEYKHKTEHSLQENLFQQQTAEKQLLVQIQKLEQNNEQSKLQIERKRNELFQLEQDISLENVKQEIKNLKIQLCSIVEFKQNISDDNLLTLVQEQLLITQTELNSLQDDQTLSQLQKKQQELQYNYQTLLIQQQHSEQQQSQNYKNMKNIKFELQQKEEQIKNLDKYNQIEREKLDLQEEYQDISNQIVQYYEAQEYLQYEEVQNELVKIELQLNEEQKRMDILIRENGWRGDFKMKAQKDDRIKEAGNLNNKIQKQLLEAQQKEQMRQNLEQQCKDLENQISKYQIDKTYEEAYHQIKLKLREAKEDKVKYIFNTTEFIDQYIEGCQLQKKCILCMQQVDKSILDKLRQRVINNQEKCKQKIQEKNIRIQALQQEKQVIKDNREQFNKVQSLIERKKELDKQLKDFNQEQINSQIKKYQNQLKDIQLINSIINSSIEEQRSSCLIKINRFDQSKLKAYKNNSQINIQTLNKRKNEIEQRLKIAEQQLNRFGNVQNIIIIQQEIAQLKSQLEQLSDMKFKSLTNEIDAKKVEVQELQKQCKLMEEQQINQKNQLQKKITLLENINPQLRKMVMKQNEFKKKNARHSNVKDQINQLNFEISDLEEGTRSINKQIEKLNSKIQQSKEIIQAIQIQVQINELKALKFDDDQLTQTIMELSEKVKQQRLVEQEQAALESKYQVQKVKLIERFNKYTFAKTDADKRFKNSEQQYQELIFQQSTLKYINDDYARYQRSIEDALIQYHRDKMKEINAFLRDTWQKIYHGNDIKYIEIKSDEDTITKKASKKSYYYRLVMKTFNNTEIDMRGRCSMGQKMLASIVFRLALAESFGSNCGVLALDEPTSNLDREHIISLAKSLKDLIEIMTHYKQVFQLIVITHDLDLVKQLSQHSSVYYKISKKETGFSQIEERQMDELQ